MKAAPSAIDAYVRFDGLLKAVAARHASLLPPVAGYAAADLASRLAQRFAELCQGRFVEAYCRADSAQRDAAVIGLDGIQAGLTDGTLQISAGTTLRLLGDFLARWCYTLLCLVASVRPRPGGGTATLVFGIAPADLFRGGDDAVFLEFCRSGPIEPLREPGLLIMQARTGYRPAPGSRARYSRSPLHALARIRGIAPLRACGLIARHAGALFRVAALCLRVPAGVLLARDFADDVLAAELDGAGAVPAVLFTNTNYLAQPLWRWARPGRRLRAHMAWYSQNVRPFLRRGDPPFPVIPARRLIRADAMWVWVPSFAAYLSGLGIRSEMHVVGPILWHLPASRPAEPTDALQIALFDMEPLREDVLHAFDIVDHYYSMETMTRFLRDIVDAGQRAAARLGKEVRFVLKHKREHAPLRDPRYSELVTSLVAAHRCFELRRPSTSVYEILAGSALAISIPYSSPVVVASHLGKPAMYYEPTGELVPDFDAAPQLQYVSGRDALEEALYLALAGGGRR